LVTRLIGYPYTHVKVVQDLEEGTKKKKTKKEGKKTKYIFISSEEEEDSVDELT
jgi:hypothetical protein